MNVFYYYVMQILIIKWCFKLHPAKCGVLRWMTCITLWRCITGFALLWFLYTAVEFSAYIMPTWVLRLTSTKLNNWRNVKVYRNCNITVITVWRKRLYAGSNLPQFYPALLRRYSKQLTMNALHIHFYNKHTFWVYYYLKYLLESVLIPDTFEAFPNLNLLN